MEHIGISVIVPIYNTKPYLKECVDSILKQEVEVPFEVLLVDDGATGRAAPKCAMSLPPRTSVCGSSTRRTRACPPPATPASTPPCGRYYAFVDSDDVVCPGYLHTLYAACEKNDAYMALCSVEDVQENGKSCDPASYTRPNAEGVFCGKDLLNEFYTPNGTVYTVAWNKLYRAEVWKLLHYPEGRLHEDDFVAHRLVLAVRQGRLRGQGAVPLPAARRAASAAPTPSPKPLTLWTAWPTATASMWKTVLTAR